MNFVGKHPYLVGGFVLVSLWWVNRNVMSLGFDARGALDASGFGRR